MTTANPKSRPSAANPATLIVVCAAGLVVLGLPTLFSATLSWWVLPVWQSGAV